MILECGKCHHRRTISADTLKHMKDERFRDLSCQETKDGETCGHRRFVAIDSCSAETVYLYDWTKWIEVFNKRGEKVIVRRHKLW